MTWSDAVAEQQASDVFYGRNGVAIIKRTGRGGGYRTYEVHQRERVGQSTEKIRPIQHQPLPNRILHRHYC